MKYLILDSSNAVYINETGITNENIFNKFSEYLIYNLINLKSFTHFTYAIRPLLKNLLMTQKKLFKKF